MLVLKYCMYGKEKGIYIEIIKKPIVVKIKRLYNQYLYLFSHIIQIMMRKLLFCNTEDTVHSHVKHFSVPMYEHVYECIQAGLTMLDDMNNDLESLYESDISLTPPLIINGLTALTFLEALFPPHFLFLYFHQYLVPWVLIFLTLSNCFLPPSTSPPTS